MGDNEEQLVRKVQDLAHKYAADAIGFFSEKYSNSPQLGAVALFHGTVAADLIGTMYSYVYENAGKDQAELWLAQLFGMANSLLKAKGVPAISEIQAPILPPDVAQPAPEAPVSTCTCTVDSAGSCQTCPGQMKESMRKTFLFFSDYILKAENLGRAAKKDGLCAVCCNEYLDAAIASVIMENTLSAMPVNVDVFCENLYQIIVRSAQHRGVTELPLTTQAWQLYTEKLSEKKPENTN